MRQARENQYPIQVGWPKSWIKSVFSRPPCRLGKRLRATLHFFRGGLREFAISFLASAQTRLRSELSTGLPLLPLRRGKCEDRNSFFGQDMRRPEVVHRPRNVEARIRSSARRKEFRDRRTVNDAWVSNPCICTMKFKTENEKWAFITNCLCVCL